MFCIITKSMMIQKINNQGLRQKQERSLHKVNECFPMDCNADFGINRSAHSIL